MKTRTFKATYHYTVSLSQEEIDKANDGSFDCEQDAIEYLLEQKTVAVDIEKDGISRRQEDEEVNWREIEEVK